MDFTRIVDNAKYLLLLGIVTSSAFADLPRRCAANGMPYARIPLTLIGDHMYTQAMLNGKGPYQVIVDTGGVNLVDATVIKELSLTITGTELGSGSGPNTVQSGMTVLHQVGVGSATFTDQPFYTFDLQQLYPSGGVRMLGMLGSNIFQRYVTCIDFQHSIIELVAPENFDRRAAGASSPLEIKQNEVMASGAFNGLPGKYLIDTGFPTVLTLASPVVIHHDLLRKYPRHVEMRSGGVGGTTREVVIRGSVLSIGSESIDNLVVELSMASKGNLSRTDMSGIVGIGALKRYIVILDFPGRRLYLQRYKPLPKDLDTWDRSGMRIEVSPHGFKIVWVAPGTPAAEAGLGIGDMILAVNGHQATSMTLPALRDLLRELPANSIVTLNVDAGGRRKKVRVVLRELL